MSNTREEQAEALRARIQERLREKRAERDRLAPAYTPPRYDEVFFEGTAWLNTL